MAEEHEGVDVKFGADIGGLQAGMNQLRFALEGLTSPIRAVRNSLGELAEAFLAAFAVERIAEFAEKIADFGEQAVHSASELGMTVEQVTALNAAFSIMGMGSDSAARALERMERNMAAAQTGTGRVADSFHALGISTTTSSGQLKTADVILGEMAEKFKNMPDGPTKTAIALELLGRQGAELIPYLDKGKEGLEEFRQVAADTGTVLDTETAQGMDETSEKFHTFGLAIKGLSVELFRDLKTPLDAILQALIDVTEKFREMLASARQALSETARYLKDQGLATGAAGFGQADVARAKALHDAAEKDKQGWSLLDTLELALTGPEVVEKRVLERRAAEKEKTQGGPAVPGVSDKEGGDTFASFTPESSSSDTGEDPLVAIERQRALADSKLAIDKAYFNDRAALIKDDYTKGTTSLDEERDALVKNENERYVAEQEAFRKKLETYTAGTTAYEQEQAKITVSTTEHLTKLEAINQQYWQQDVRIRTQAAQDAITIANRVASTEEQQTKAAYQANQISLDQETAALIAEENKRFEIIKAEMLAEAALYGQNAPQRQKILDQIEAAEKEHTQKLIKINQEATKEYQKQWQSVLKPIENQFSTMVTDMIFKTTTWQQAVASIVQSAAKSFISKGVQLMVDSWLMGEETKTAATVAGEGTRVAAQAAGAAAGGAVQGASQKKSIMGDAYTAAANVYQSVSGIPYVGWVLAPIAAAAAFAAVAAFGSGIPSFEVGAWNVGSAGMANIHQGEMIVPAGPAQAFRDAFSGNGGVGGGPVHVYFQISALDGRSVSQLLKQQGTTMAQVIAGQIRNANSDLSGALKKSGG